MAYCKNCGQSVDPNAAVCMSCGFSKGTGSQYCANCGKTTTAGAAICTSCGFALQGSNGTVSGEGKSKLTAGLLGIFLGGFGVHNFYLGKKGIAILQLILGIVGFVLIFCWGIGIFVLMGTAIWGLIEGILILTGSIKTDGKGNPLKS